ncbi:hypothetical protein [Nannocystis pusilla]|uniref:Uncharacterized protein n=1 Tax=Nannocystis pusilla TaxID=889268 RepID=A0ABS7THT9_9BACT|nr:hypothetical protein [Nannocystis pusilla]MBZ5707782.1 hypothetical protein [Nannocystis pusilla]
MSRKLLMLAPALAFALPIVASLPTMARPLATQAVETRWGDNNNNFHDHDDDDDDDDHNNNDDFIEIAVCFQAQLVLADDNRAYSCDIVDGPTCLSRCTPEAVAPLCATELAGRAFGSEFAACQAERMATCRSQCDSGGAAFCSPEDAGLKTRGGDHDDHDDHDDDDDDDDNNNNVFENIDVHKDDGFIFIDIEICFDLVIDEDNR